MQKRIRTLGAPAIEDYMKFLRAGSSDHPIELLRIAGVDMASPQAVAETVEEFETTLEELEKLLVTTTLFTAGEHPLSGGFFCPKKALVLSCDRVYNRR